jgi:hypothetical protein
MLLPQHIPTLVARAQPYLTSKTASFEIGREITRLFVWTRAALIFPSLLGMTSTTLPRLQQFLGELESTIRTRSSFSICLTSSNHFDRRVI